MLPVRHASPGGFRCPRPPTGCFSSILARAPTRKFQRWRMSRAGHYAHYRPAAPRHALVLPRNAPSRGEAMRALPSVIAARVHLKTSAIRQRPDSVRVEGPDSRSAKRPPPGPRRSPATLVRRLPSMQKRRVNEAAGDGARYGGFRPDAHRQRVFVTLKVPHWSQARPCSRSWPDRGCLMNRA